MHNFIPQLIVHLLLQEVQLLIFFSISVTTFVMYISQDFYDISSGFHNFKYNIEKPNNEMPL